MLHFEGTTHGRDETGDANHCQRKYTEADMKRKGNLRVSTAQQSVATTVRTQLKKIGLVPEISGKTKFKKPGAVVAKRPNFSAKMKKNFATPIESQFPTLCVVFVL